MKILCGGCEAAEASVMCCADEAALCGKCDEHVHGANKLAGMHQRVQLVGGGEQTIPGCDICQELSGIFFCLEDRALLCRNCDVVIHSANPYVSTHRRFLLSGVQAGNTVDLVESKRPYTSTKPVEHRSISPPEESNSAMTDGENILVYGNQFFHDMDLINKASFSSTPASAETTNWAVPNKQLISLDQCAHLQTKRLRSGFTKQLSAESVGVLDHQASMNNGPPSKMYSSGFLNGGIPDWSPEFREFSDAGCFSYADHRTSKADSGKFGSSDNSFCSGDDYSPDHDKYFGQVPEIQKVTAKSPSPPTASGLHWHRNLRFVAPENAAYVPDILSPESPLR